MIAYTEFSPYGYANICTYVHADTFRRAMELLSNPPAKLRIEPWDDAILDAAWKPTGIDRCLRRLKEEEVRAADLVCLGWSPRTVPACMRSISLLGMCLRILSSDGLPDVPGFEGRPGAYVEVDCLERGSCGVSANFDDGIWAALGRPGFQEQTLPAMNAEIRRWHENAWNQEISGQYGTLFQGKDGLTLMLSHPSGDGIWMVGSQKGGFGGLQMCDHNTRGAGDGWDHVVALCAVVKHCRLALGIV